MRIDDQTFCLSKLEIKAILHYRGRDTTRPALCAVRFGDRSVVATDGHRLALLRTDSAGPDVAEFLVDSEPLERAAKVPKAETIRVRAVAPGKAEIIVHNAFEQPLGTFESTVLPDTTFPPYRQVLPEARPAGFEPRPTGFAMSGEYLADLLPVQRAAGRHGIELRPGPDVVDPLVATVGDEWTIVIMPIRGQTQSPSDAERQAAGAWRAIVGTFERDADAARALFAA